MPSLSDYWSAAKAAIADRSITSFKDTLSDISHIRDYERSFEDGRRTPSAEMKAWLSDAVPGTREWDAIAKPERHLATLTQAAIEGAAIGNQAKPRTLRGEIAHTLERAANHRRMATTEGAPKQDIAWAKTAIGHARDLNQLATKPPEIRMDLGRSR